MAASDPTCRCGVSLGGHTLGSHRLYNGSVPQPTSAPHLAALATDTTADVEQRQIDSWRRLSPLERLRLVSDTTRAVVNLSLAGIRRRHPQASERECFLRLAAILLGADTVRRIYPDAAQMTDLRGPCWATPSRSLSAWLSCPEPESGNRTPLRRRAGLDPPPPFVPTRILTSTW